jgi:hypothetical protein
MNEQPSQGFSIDNNHVSQDPPTLKSQRPGKKGKVARRGTAFTKEEDLVVCSAFLNVSKDPITGNSLQLFLRNLCLFDAQITWGLAGVNQTSGGYYKRMHDYFNEHKPEGSNRSQIAIQHRWALIQKAMNMFCGHKESIDRLNESGKNEQDRVYFH